MGLQKKLYLGNLDAKRDWGHAKIMLRQCGKCYKQKTPDDFVIATGKQYSVRQFVNFVSKRLDIKIIWKGKGIKERAIDVLTKKIIVNVIKIILDLYVSCWEMPKNKILLRDLEYVQNLKPFAILFH